MYASITHIKNTPNECSFTLSLANGELEITSERIGSILNVPHDPHAIQFVSDSISKEKVEVNNLICGFQAAWDHAKNFLRHKNLQVYLHVVHNIFTFNVYPRKGNQTELTAYMENILVNAVSGHCMCLPSIICRTIIHFSLAQTKKGSAPFGCLMTALALSLNIPIPNEKPEILLAFDVAHLHQMNLQRHPLARVA